MVTPQPSTSDTVDFISSNEETKLNEYGKETYTLLKYILQEIEVDKDKNIKNEFPLQRAQRYTGLNINALTSLVGSVDEAIIYKVTETDRKCVHDALMSYYLDKHVIPTTTELFCSLQDSLPLYEDIRSFRKKLIKMGYIFRKKADCFVVYEKPSIRFERFLYLKNILQFREDKRHIYYLSELDLSLDDVSKVKQKAKKQLCFYFAVSSLEGVQFLKDVNNFDQVSFNSWILNEVIPNIEANSVVILDNTKHNCDIFCETPEKTSPSYIMIKWLIFHEIPFKDTMSTIELYTLIEKYTDLHLKLYKVDMWLKQNGHDVLRLPNCINEMTPASHVRHFIKRLKCEEISKSIGYIASKISETELNSYNLMLNKEETRLYNLEIKVDNVLEHLKPSFNIEEDLYLPLSDSD